MEFRRSKPERRHDRRICPRCKVTSGARDTCAGCKVATQPRLRIVWYVDGKRHRQLTQCWREQDANEILRRKEADYWRQQDLGVTRDVGGTLREGVDAFLATKAGCSVEYRRQLRNALNAFGNGLGWEHPIVAVSSDDIARYKEEGLAVLSSSSVRSYMLVVRRCFGYLHDEGWIRRNPTRKVKLPPARRGRDHLRPEEVPAVLQKFWELSPDLAPIITALVLGGWRKGEIINLRRRDLYLAERWAYVLDFEGDELTSEWSPKTESSRRAVSLHPLVVRALERVKPVECPDGSISPWVFPVTDTRKRKRYRDSRGRMQSAVGDRRSSTTSFLGLKLREVLDAVGHKQRVTIHGLRRTFAVLLQETGASDAVIRQALGHGARGVTETHYLPRRDETVRRWVDAIEMSVPALAAGDPRPSDSASASASAENEPEFGAAGENRCPHIAPALVAKRAPYLRLVD